MFLRTLPHPEASQAEKANSGDRRSPTRPTDRLSGDAPSQMFLPRSILGEYVQGGAKESVRGAEKAYLQLQSLYASVAKAKPYNLEQELRSPINLENNAMEITPLEYSHIVAAATGKAKQ